MKVLRQCVVVLFFLMFSVEGFAQVVDIPDSNLRDVIERALGKRAGARITADEMATLSHLSANWREIRDLTGLESAINLRHLNLQGNLMTDLSPIAGLTRLDWLSLRDCRVSDISPLSGLLRLGFLDLSFNLLISDLSPIAGLVHLGWLGFRENAITDLSPIVGLVNLHHIEMEGNFVTDLSPLLANIGLGDADSINVAFNPLSDDSLKKHIPALRRKGVYVNMAAFVSDISLDPPLRIGDEFRYDFKIESGTDLSGWQVTLTYRPTVIELLSISYGDFLGTGNVTTIPQEGTKIDAAALTINPRGDHNEIRDLFQVRLGNGVTGNGVLFSCTFRVIGIGSTSIWLPDSFLMTSDGRRIRAAYSFDNYWTSDAPSVDINGDGQVDLADLVAIAPHIGTDNDQYDVDNNGRVDIADMIYVIQHFGTTPRSPSAVSDMALLERLTPSMVKEWIDMAHAADDGSEAFRKGIATFKNLLDLIAPKETVLLANYPNPFNPETWIPYHLARDADVKLTIYDMAGAVVRRFDLGYQPAGYYTDRAKAVYWDGRNAHGEQVGSGVYFYHLQAGDYSHTRRLVILK